MRIAGVVVGVGVIDAPIDAGEATTRSPLEDPRPLRPVDEARLPRFEVVLTCHTPLLPGLPRDHAGERPPSLQVHRLVCSTSTSLARSSRLQSRA